MNLAEENRELRRILRQAYLFALEHAEATPGFKGTRLTVAEERQLGRDLAKYGTDKLAAQKPEQSAQKLTKADHVALTFLPEGWFNLRQVPYQVRNPYWRCDRLVELGLLESQVRGNPQELDSIVKWWRKVKDGTQ